VPVRPRRLLKKPSKFKGAAAIRGSVRAFDYDSLCANQRLRMLFSSLRTLVKVAVASLIVGTILSHFGITAEALLREAGITPERVTEYGQRAWDWAAPNLMLGAMVIIPVWFLVFLFRPPGAKSE
jgi:hypothetical protein